MVYVLVVLVRVRIILWGGRKVSNQKGVPAYRRQLEPLCFGSLASPKLARRF